MKYTNKHAPIRRQPKISEARRSTPGPIIIERRQARVATAGRGEHPMDGQSGSGGTSVKEEVAIPEKRVSLLEREQTVLSTMSNVLSLVGQHGDEAINYVVERSRLEGQQRETIELALRLLKKTIEDWGSKNPSEDTVRSYESFRSEVARRIDRGEKFAYHLDYEIARNHIRKVGTSNRIWMQEYNPSIDSNDQLAVVQESYSMKLLPKVI